MRVLVTRPQAEASQWIEDLRRRGFDPVPLPLIAIVPVPQIGEPGRWRSGEAGLDRSRGGAGPRSTARPRLADGSPAPACASVSAGAGGAQPLGHTGAQLTGLRQLG